MSRTSPARGRPRQEAVTARLVASARSRFATHGFDGTTMADIARDAGVGVGTAYLRFDTKQDLLAAVLADVEREFGEAMARSVATHAEWPARFHAMFLALLEQAARTPDLAALMHLGEQAGLSAAADNSIRRMIRQLLQTGIETGALRAVHVDVAAAAAHGMVTAVMLGDAIRTRASRRRAAETLTDLAVRWLLP